MTQILYVFIIPVEYIYLGKFNSEKNYNSSEDSTRTERFFSDDSYFTSVNPVRYQKTFLQVSQSQVGHKNTVQTILIVFKLIYCHFRQLGLSQRRIV
jgi:hypothetical protein